MPKFTLAPKGDDPYRNLKFRINSDNRYVAGLSKSKVLEKDMEGTGSLSTIRKLPVKKKSETIILTSGMSHDTTFENWANMCNNFQGDASMSLKNFRKNIIIDVFNEANQKTISYRVNKCWVSVYQAVPDLDAGANVVMIQTIKLENDSWERI